MRILASSIKVAPASIARKVGAQSTIAAFGAKRLASAGGTYHSRLIYTGGGIGRRPASLARQRPSEELSPPTWRKIATMASAQDDQTEIKAKKDAEVGKEPEKPKLPPLSAAEFRAYNHLAEKMDYFHNHFRHTWNMLYEAASSGRRPQGMTLKQFIEEGLSFVRFLTMHHDIEESYVFPQLARKMPEFRAGGSGGRAELLRQHKEIHAGMDEFESYLHSCKVREVDLEMRVLKEKMDGWGGVLWKHLDQEVETLGAENMRRYWTLDEVRRLGI